MKKLRKFKDEMSKKDSKRKPKMLKPKKQNRYSPDDKWNKIFRKYIIEEE